MSEDPFLHRTQKVGENGSFFKYHYTLMINWCNIAHKTEIKKKISTNAFLLGNTVCWDWGKQSVGRNCYKICLLGDTILTHFIL